MKRRVVDTNVAIVANGRKTNAGPKCRLAAVDALFDLIENGRIVIDAAGEMLAEYRPHLNSKGQPGVGDRFMFLVMQNYDGKVERIVLGKAPDDSFVDFPDDPALASFDRADRKFAAAARKAQVPVMNATDSGWFVHRAAFKKNGIKVEFVCGSNWRT